jgi:NCS1 family nucleobase:cation symporter-1
MEKITPDIVECAVGEQSQNMTLEKVFWSHFSPNLTPATWIVGTLLIVLGLNFWTSIAVIIVGNCLGATPVALAATMGPKTGLPQIESSRFAFGKMGTRLPALINWVCCIGWDSINNITSTLALISLIAIVNIQLPFWLVLGLLVLIQAVVSVYGHDLVQVTEKYLGYFLLITFGLVGTLALFKGGSISQGNILPATSTIIICIAIVASFNLSWAPYSADYTRYLPRNTSAKVVFLLSWLGLVCSASMMEFFGMMTAGAITNPSPGAVLENIAVLVGPIAPLALLAIGVSSIAANAINDNTASYSLISSGIKLSRPMAAIVVAILSYIMAVYGSGQFATVYENYLLVILYWVSPWSGIILTHWFLIQRYSLSESYSNGWTVGATIFSGVTVITISLFSSTQIYRGPVAGLLNGADIGYLVGFIAAVVLYAFSIKFCKSQKYSQSL